MTKKLDGLRIANEIAEKHGGKCLSEEYININTKMTWECEFGHQWKAPLDRVKNAGCWCLVCSGRAKLNGIEIAQELAAELDGECLSTEYINGKSKLKWKCKEGHIWNASLHSVKNSEQWCPKCAIKRNADSKRLDGLKIANEIAKQKGGKCLSEKYIGYGKHLEWMCKEGHIWETSLAHVKGSGSWCPVCGKKSMAKKIRLQNGLQIAKDIAKERDGECLSNEYVGTNKKMKWKCKEGHVWKARLTDIRRNHWCPECAQIQRAKTANNSYILTHWKTGEDLVCQASWEKATVEYFNANKINFRWQSRSFLMPDGRRYYPDCYLFSTKKWIEIKGYFRDDAQEKWEWFQTIKPNSELWNQKKLKKMSILN